ncbi:uncharacterized protein [Cherax quadricarinatus]
MQRYLGQMSSVVLVVLVTSCVTQCWASPQHKYQEGTKEKQQPPHDTTDAVYRTPGTDDHKFEYHMVEGAPAWNQRSREWNDEVTTSGSYTVKLPDGRVQRVTYTADEHGFRPVITYQHPEGGTDYHEWKKTNVEKKAEGKSHDKKITMAEDGKDYMKDHHHHLKVDYNLEEMSKQISPSAESPESLYMPFSEDTSVHTQMYDSPRHSYSPHNIPMMGKHQPVASKSSETSPSLSQHATRSSLSATYMAEKYQLHDQPEYMKNIGSSGAKHNQEKPMIYRFNSPRPTHQPMGSRNSEYMDMRKPTNGQSKSYMLMTDTDMTRPSDSLHMKDKSMKQDVNTKKNKEIYRPIYRQDMDDFEKMKPFPYLSKMKPTEHKKESSDSSKEDDKSYEGKEPSYMEMISSVLPPNKPFVASNYYPSSLSSLISFPSLTVSRPRGSSFAAPEYTPDSIHLLEASHKMAAMKHPSSPSQPRGYHPQSVSPPSSYDHYSDNHNSPPQFTYLPYSYPHIPPHHHPHRSYYKPSAASPHQLSHFHSLTSHAQFPSTKSYSSQLHTSHPPTVPHSFYAHPHEAPENIMKTGDRDNMN